MKRYYQSSLFFNNRTTLLCCILTFMSIQLLCSCNSKDKDGLPADVADGESAYPTAEEMLRDSIAKKEDVSNECASICQRMIQTEEMLSSVKSPDALISAKKEYLNLTSSINKELSSISKEDKKVATAYKANLDKAYNAACKEYEIPANGVISNLNNLIRRIDKIHTQSEFFRFQDVRIGMLRKLDDLHLCVEHNSTSIAEVKRLAQTLKSKYESKKKELGIE